MTSFVLKPHIDRKPYPTAWNSPADKDCPFCQIIKKEMQAWIVYEDESVIAVLDILPIRRGHTLVIPKGHYPRLSELPPQLAGPTGEAVSKVALAIRQGAFTVNDIPKEIIDLNAYGGLGISGLNVVCNEEYAQAVPHVHYHIIPAPVLNTSSPFTSAPKDPQGDSRLPLSHREMHRLEVQNRDELDDDEANIVWEVIKSKL